MKLGMKSAWLGLVVLSVLVFLASLLTPVETLAACSGTRCPGCVVQDLTGCEKCERFPADGLCGCTSSRCSCHEFGGTCDYN